MSAGVVRTDAAAACRPAAGVGEAVSAVVVNHDGGDQVLRCLEALARQQPALAEVIVVDSGSSDGSPDRIRRSFPSVRVIELGGNLGPAAARNVGLQQAGGRLVLLVDDDVYLAADCLRGLLRCARAMAAAAVVPRLVLLPESTLIQADGGDVHFVGTLALRNGRLAVGATAPERLPIGAFSSSCVLLDRALVLRVGGFDEAYFFYFEDKELGLRLRAFGAALWCDATAIAYHERGAGTSDLSFREGAGYPGRRAYLTLRNRLRTMLLHYDLRTLLLLAPALLIYEAAVFAFALRQGWLRPWLQAWRWQLVHRREILARRRWIQARRRVHDGDLLISGPLPIAPGLLQTPFQVHSARALGSLLDGYWRLARPLLRGRRRRSPRWLPRSPEALAMPDATRAARGFAAADRLPADAFPRRRD